MIAVNANFPVDMTEASDVRHKDRGREASTFFVRAVTEQRALLHLAAVLLFLLVTVAAFAAQYSDRPRSAGIIYVLGVSLVGAMEGFWGGMLAALIACLIYNFFLSDPVLTFRFATTDDLVPVFVFTVSAAASGLLTGWLKDRALAAELATRRIKLLFDVSEKLQHAVQVSEIPSAIEEFTRANGKAELYLRAPDGSVLGAEAGAQAQLAGRLAASGVNRMSEAGHTALLVPTPTEKDAIVVLPENDAGRSDTHQDLKAFLNLLSITLERCQLHERLAETEALRRSEEYKTALLSSVSHDMRTPLAAISASASSLARFGSKLPESARADLLATIQEQCERLNRYTTNLLNLGRLQFGIDATRFVECDVLEVLGTAIARTRNLGSGHEIDKHYEVDVALLLADPVTLEQVFYNVLENAVRYSPATSPILVRVGREAGQIVIEMSDHGPGISEEDRERVFDRFYRGGAAAVEVGSGLGLSIAKGFVEAFGGTIAALPADPDRAGATIRIALPLGSAGSDR
jgi:two-component system sensor histidine kinase KdpD